MPVRVSAPAQSDRLIEAALSAGTINATTALKYRVFAAYDDPRLPFQFVGNQRPRFANEIGFQLAAAYETMSAADQAEMGPFMLPPIYRDSWRGLRRAARTAAATIDATSTIPRVTKIGVASGTDARVRAAAAARPAPCSGLIDAGWVAVDSAHFRVWYDTSAPPATAVTPVQAASVSAAAEESYLALLALGMRAPLADNALAHPCHGGDGRLDIYIVEPGSSGTDEDDAPGIPSNLGVTVTINDGGTPSPVFINLSANTLGGGKMFGTLAHEYMHAVQAAYRNHGSAGAGAGVFLKDATADWAIDYVRAADNLEQASAPGLLGDMLPPLWSTAASGRRYGAYLFFQFVARVRDSAGNDYGGAAVVRSFWEQLDAQPAGAVRPLAALDAALPRGLTATWHAFAVSAWNQGPVDDFNKIDGLTTGAVVDRSVVVTPSFTNPVFATPESGTPAATPTQAELSARYERFTFPDSAFAESISTVTFFNGYTFGLQSEPVPLLNTLFSPPLQLSAGNSLAAFLPINNERAARALTALIRINGRWTVEDWTSTPIRFFCRDKIAERVEEIVLVYSNGAFTNIRDAAGDDNNAVGSMFTAPANPAGLSSRFVVSKMPCYQMQGEASGRATVMGSGNNFTVTNRLTATLRGRAASFNGTLRGRNVTLLPGVRFDTVSGTLNSALAGVVAGCRVAPFNETAPPQAMPDGQQTPSFTLLTNYLPNASAFNGYSGAGGRSFFGLDPAVCGAGRSVDTPAPAAFDFDALWNAPVVNAIFKVDLANRRLRATDVEGPTAFTGSFSAPVTTRSSWCFVASREGEAPPTGACP